MQQSTTSWGVPLFFVLAVVLALLTGWFLGKTEDTVEPVAHVLPDTVAESIPVEAVPSYRLPEITVPTEEILSLPELTASDDYVLQQLSELLSPALTDWVRRPGVAERIVATIDALPGSAVAERIQPLVPVDGLFLADGQDGSGTYRLRAVNYERYTPLIQMLFAAEPQTVFEVYQKNYPLLQQAYVNLGYPDGYFNDRLIEVIDHLLETPDIDEEIELVRPHVLYEFGIPALESLSAGQKLLLRMGRANRQQVLENLKSFRALNVASSSSSSAETP